MPPSPARFSPGRELKADNHKRGRSLESGMHFREKEDDLALFNEVQSKETDNFLLQSNDDFDDLFGTRLRYFSDCKLAVSVPARGESSDFLNTDGDKNDYDWLITPPDTPLFPSLDDETPQVNLVSRGRPRSQPRSISRSSTMEKSYQSSRGSASPNRLSPSPRPAYGTYPSRGRPSSTSHAGSPPTLQHLTPLRRSSPSPNKYAAPSLSPPPTCRNTTPSRRPSPPPNKPSISVSRSATPIPRRRSTDCSTTVASSRTRGASPVKTSRGNSMSPKIKAWQSNIPGFSSEVPPNLRTSLADRPASNMRGSSPASRTGLKSGRQSTSPSGSRSVSSSQSHDRDQFISRGRGSIASSGDDDVDSMLSISMSTSSAPKSISSSINDKAPAYSKRPNRIVSQSSAPKRSSDVPLRKDQQKIPHNRFRPLLSSVPTSTFYSGKASAAQSVMMSRNSSVTTSNNTSTSGVHDTVDSERNPEEVTSMYTVTPISSIQDSLCAYNDGDATDEDGGDKMHVVSSSSQYGKLEEHVEINFESVDNKSCVQHDSSVGMTSAAGVLVGEVDLEDLVVCSKCSCSFDAVDLIEGYLRLCPNCRSSELIPVITTPLTRKAVGNFPLPESPGTRDSEQAYHDVVINNDQRFQSEANINVLSKDYLAEELIEKRLVNHPETGQSCLRDEISGCGISSQEGLHVQANGNTKIEVPEAAGIPLLFRRSSSCIGHIVQNRGFVSSELPTDELAYVRDSTYSLSSSIGHGSMSTSSSTDLSSVKHAESRIQRQHSGKKSEHENYRYDLRTKHQRSTSYFSGASTHNFQFLTSTTNSFEEGSDLSLVHVEKNILEEKHTRPQEINEVSVVHLAEDILEEACAESQEESVTDAGREGGFTGLCDSGCGTTREHSSNNTVTCLESNAFAPVSNCEEFTSCVDGDDTDLLANEDVDRQAAFAHCLCETNAVVASTMSNPCVDGVQVQDESGLDTSTKIGAENGEFYSSDPESVFSSPNPTSKEDGMQESPIIGSSDVVVAASVDESENIGHAHGILEESTVVVEGQKGLKARSLTLDEATDTILFCSSIVQNLAYEAANTAIEKENSALLESSRPIVTIVGKANTDRRVPRNKNASKRTPKLQKSKKSDERENKPPTSKTESEEGMEDVSTTKLVGAPNKGDSLRPPKLESKCNCTIM
ncbi:hypothetical protein Leryth_021514 [Lithospermum erythrorhizon]|nr:hypothetical protein Leryth_021514 [Lithospermum erythrorhizon]